MESIRAALDLIRFNRPIGTFLLFLPGLWGLLAGWNGSPPFRILAIFFMGAFFMRSAGCAINDILDRNIDGQVDRTRSRPIPSGRISVRGAVAVLVVFSGLAASLLAFLKPLTIAVAVVGFGAAMIYPLTKRFLPVPQLFMGIPFGLTAPIMAWTEARGSIGWAGVAIGLAGLFWSTAYDLVYAISDREDDIQAGVRSGAVTFGGRLWIAVLLFGGSATLFLASAGADLGLTRFFPWSLVLFFLLIFYQAFRIRSGLDPRLAQSYFRAHLWIGAIVAIGFWGAFPIFD